MVGNFDGARIGIALTGSFCTFGTVFDALPRLTELGAKLIPIMSPHAHTLDTRFYTANQAVGILEDICGSKCLSSITDVEPIGPAKMLDLLLIAPCTGNTIAKIAHGIADTAVTMAVKSQLRNERPVLIAISTNDGLGANAQNIGKLMARKHIYFVPYRQDDPSGKPSSLVFVPETLAEACEQALSGRQLQPLLRVSKGE